MRSSVHATALALALGATSCLMNFEQYRPGDAAPAPDVRHHDAADVASDVPADDALDAATDAAPDDVAIDAPARDVVDVVSPMDHADVVAPMDHADVVAPIDVGTDARPDVPVPMDVQPDVPVGGDSGVVPGCSAPFTGGAAGTAPCMALRVNEVQTAGGAGASDEFVEIYNAGSCAVALTGWTLRYTTSTGTTPSVRWTGMSGMLASGGYAVVGGASFPCSNVVGRFAGPSGALAATGGGIGLFDPSGTRVDSVGYGPGAMNPMVEGTATVAPGTGQSIARSATGADTNNNVVDFALRTSPTPGAPNP